MDQNQAILVKKTRKKINTNMKQHKIHTNQIPPKQQDKVDQGISIIQHLYAELENLREHNLYQQDKLNMLTRIVKYHFGNYLDLDKGLNDGISDKG